MEQWEDRKQEQEPRVESVHMAEATNRPLAGLFPPIPQRFLEILYSHCDKEGPAASVLSGGTYLKRLAEMGMLDAAGFCSELNHVFFVGQPVLHPALLGEYNVTELVAWIKEKSALGGVLKVE